ncbi:MAG: cysteine hydrolase [Chloroflexi bacterium]|nr:cysteine hydrolase [Chloroflexota bacterium]
MLIIDGKEVLTTLQELVDPEHNALLLIDLQNDYVMPGGFSDKQGSETSAARQMVPQVKQVLEAARRHGVLRIHVQMTSYANSLSDSPASLRMQLLHMSYESNKPFKGLTRRCIENSWGWQIVEELTPLPDEIVIRKHRSSAFMGTDLDMMLRSNGIQTVTIAGVVTQGCVMATAKHAQLLDYYPVLLRDCIASHKATCHDAALLIMSSSMDIADSREVLDIWRSNRSAER